MNKFLVVLSSVLLLTGSAFAEGAAGGSAMSSILMLVAFFAIFY